MTLVSDVNNSSLQLVEMCGSEGVWSPVCDNNWTLQDATVVCRELKKQGLLSKAGRDKWVLGGALLTNINAKSLLKILKKLRIQLGFKHRTF